MICRSIQVQAVVNISPETPVPLLSHVRMADTDLNLVLMSCPGARIAGGNRVSTQADLARDVRALEDRGVRMMITCPSDAELALDMDAYARAYTAAGIEWRRVGIPDMTPPTPRIDLDLLPTLAAARQIMASGGAVAIHCMAGLGRTGTVAARLVMGYGLTAADAIAFVRAAHSPAAIETREQERYLHSAQDNGRS
tara:strand:+ start:3816 stop:4403 length:588 start_codon:yes stop_codon:yes gene_type:complete